MQKQVLENLKRSISGVVAGSLTVKPENINVGFLPISPDEEFISNIITNGPSFEFRVGQLDGYINEQLGQPIYKIPCDLWFGFEKDESNNLYDLMELLDRIRQQFYSMNGTTKWSKPEYDGNQNPVFGHVELTVDVPDTF